MTQNASPPWPQLVHDAITSLFGRPIHVHFLGGGQSQANVWRVQFPARSVIVKRTKQPRERLFYTTIAPLLQEARIPVPHLEWSDVVADDHWLILEDIPTPCLGEATTFRAVADRYLSQRAHSPLLAVSSRAALMHDIIIAKIWSVTEYLSMYSRGTLAHSTTINALIQQFPEWLDRLLLDGI